MSQIKKNLSEYLSQIQKHLFLIMVFLCLSIGICLIIAWAINPNQAPSWTGFGKFQNANGDFEREKTLWDWMNLLIVPMALAIGAFLLNRAERFNEYQIAKERILENTLQDYLDKMTELLLKENLRESENNDESQSIARSRTLTALRILDQSRKGVLLKFIYESRLISQIPVIKLKGADLSEADLKKANLSDGNISRSTLISANLEQARLIQTDFSYCKIEKANFTRSSLMGANFNLANCDNAIFTRATIANTNFDSASMKKAVFLSVYGIKANFQSAQLQHANFTNANLREANLDRANLKYANFENADLTGASLCGANLQHANLKGAILDNADLSFANLENAKIKSTQLKKVISLSVAVMMDGNLFQGEKDGNNSHGR